VGMKISKANENIEYFSALIDEIRMSGQERLRAKARLAQGEAMADALVGFLSLGKRLLLWLARPASAGEMPAGERREGEFSRIA